MSIRTKMVSLLALLFVTLIGLDIIVQKTILMPSFAELERDDAKTSMKRISYALDMALDGLVLTATDWGNWQDVYQYVQAPNAAFVATNITPLAMRQLQVNALMIVNAQGEVVLSSTQDLETGAKLAINFAARRTLAADFPWHQNLSNGRTARGLVETNQGVMMIAAAPVLNGTGSGDQLGMVIMGQLLTPLQLHMLGARAQAKLSMSQQHMPAAADEIRETSRATQVDRTFQDIYGHPLMTLSVEVPRNITARGQDAVTYASVYLVGAAVTVLVLLIVILNRVVLGPLARVTRHAVAIGKSNDLLARLNLPGEDEVAVLAREFDGMVGRVADTRRQLVDQSFQEGFAELAKGVLHNLGNAMTPVGVRLSKLGERLRDAPTSDLELACTELAAEPAGSARRGDLEQFLGLGCRELSATVKASQEDVAVIQRQTVIVQTALSELMRSTRQDDHVIESVRLPELVSQTLEIVPDACRQRLVVDADDSLRRVGVVLVARTVLRLVLQNLIINAADAVRDAGRDKGVLHVAAEIVRGPEHHELHLRCRDDGVGIPAQDLERVFDKGFSTKSKDTNYGIGLHWCANAIAALGGKIWAASEGPGRGASMHLMLPLSATEI